MNEQQIKWDDLAIVPLPLEPASLQTENWIEPDVHLGDATLEKLKRGRQEIKAINMVELFAAQIPRMQPTPYE